MIQELQHNISNFFVAGINYKKTDAAIRGEFAINHDQYVNLLNNASSLGVFDFFILSTCNRTEIYGFAESAAKLVNLICTETCGSKELFNKLSYTKQGVDAVQHLFEVGAGLESQILGDYEIIGQIKSAVKISKQHNSISGFMERLVNSVLQSNKIIKNQTGLSGGTVSVSFAAIQYIKRHVSNIADKKILLIGVGKIGRNTCRNLVDYLDTKNITLINRTEDKATQLAAELGLGSASFDELHYCIQSSDIILVATNANEPTILHSHLQGANHKIIIDLSIPYNVEDKARGLSNITLVNVDELSKLKDETLQKRIAEVPKAKKIIEEHIVDFLEWNNMRKNAPVINALKQKLHDMQQCSMFLLAQTTLPASSPLVTVNEVDIKKVIKNMAVKMRSQHQPGCSYIEAINDFISCVN